MGDRFRPKHASLIENRKKKNLNTIFHLYTPSMVALEVFIFQENY